MKKTLMYSLLLVIFLAKINFAFAEEAKNDGVGYVNKEEATTEQLGSAYKIGDLLCGSNGEVCVNSHKPWGMVIYVDPKPSASGFEGIAMMLNDRTADVPWAVAPSILNDFVGADHYNIYGGFFNQRAYCSHDDSDCRAEFSPPNTSAFNACTTYRGGKFKDWYLPSIFETLQMFNVAQQMTYGANSKPPYECHSPYTACEPHFFVNFQLQDYWSSTEGYGFAINAPNPDPTSALFMDLDNIFLGGGNNKDVVSSVRCVRAIPA